MWKLDRILDVARAIDWRHHDLNRHATFAFRGSRLLAVGINSRKSNPCNIRLPFYGREGAFYGASAGTHSELSCLIRLGLEDTSRITFVNVRLGALGGQLYAKPCRACTALLAQTGWRRIYFTTPSGLEEFAAK